jgi:hypothetical protein
VEAPRQTVNRSLRDVIGKRGENIVELCLTDYDYYVEIETVQGKRPFFFVQAKATAATSTVTSLRISSTKDDVAGLLPIPAPT